MILALFPDKDLPSAAMQPNKKANTGYTLQHKPSKGLMKAVMSKFLLNESKEQHLFNIYMALEHIQVAS